MSDGGQLPAAGRTWLRPLLVVMLATGVASNVGFALGVLGPQLRADLGISRTVLGVLSSAFFAATGAASVTAGRFVRRFGPRRMAMCALAVQCAVCLVAGLIGAYLPVLFAAVLAGAAYAVVNVAGNRVVRSISDDAHLGRFMTVKTSGVPVATTIVALASAVTIRWGWQPIVVGLGVCAAVAAVLAGTRILASTDAATGAPARRDDRLARSFALLPFAGFCFIAGSQPLYAWTPSYLHESLQVSAGAASLAVAIATGLGVPAMIGIARLADHFGGLHRAQFIAALCATTAAALVLVLLAPHIGVGSAVVGLAIGAAANLAVAGLFPALVVEYAPHAIERGTGVAMTGYFLGALVSPIGFGALADRTGGYAVPWLVCIALLVVGAVLCLLTHIYTRHGAVLNPTDAAARLVGDGRTVSSPLLDA